MLTDTSLKCERALFIFPLPIVEVNTQELVLFWTKIMKCKFEVNMKNILAVVWNYFTYDNY